MPGKRTIDDIARMVGVSKATVSRVLNNKPDVDPVTRERVLRVVEEQNFVPSITASALAVGQSRLIGVLVPAFTWPFIPDVMRGVAEIIGLTSYELVLYSINDTVRERDKGEMIDRILATKLVAGLLAVLPGPSASYVTHLYKQGFPVVMIDDQELPIGVPWIGADNQAGAYAATRYLLALGHRRIAHIQGPMKYSCSRERHQGFCQALQEEGLVPDPMLVLEGDFLSLTGKACASKLFSLPEEERPTAIFASSDLMAYGVLAMAEEYGLCVPGDLAVVGFDDISSSAHMRPTLTTVKQPFYEMGLYGTDLLLSILNTSKNFVYRLPEKEAFGLSPSPRVVARWDMSDDKAIHIHLSTELIVRASSGAA